MTQTLLLPNGRVRFVNEDGTLSPWAVRMFQILWERVGGAFGDGGTDVLAQIQPLDASQQGELIFQQISPDFVAPDVTQPAIIKFDSPDVVQAQPQSDIGEMVFQPFSGTAQGIINGSAGAVLYQVSPDVTGFSAVGSSGQVLLSGGAGTPTWTSGTLSLGSNLSTTGGAVTLTATGATNVTLPTSGTLSTLAGTESLTNKKLGSLTSNGLVQTSGGDGTLSVLAPGTGVATALAVNVDTDGAFVVKGGALGSPSSAGTMPAFTLGGDVALNGKSFTGAAAFSSSATISGNAITDAILMRTANQLAIANASGTTIATFNHATGKSTFNYDVTAAGTLTLSTYGGGTGVVSVGAADSGGAGYRLLRVPN